MIPFLVPGSQSSLQLENGTLRIAGRQKMERFHEKKNPHMCNECNVENIEANWMQAHRFDTYALTRNGHLTLN